MCLLTEDTLGPAQPASNRHKSDTGTDLFLTLSIKQALSEPDRECFRDDFIAHPPQRVWVIL